MQPISMVVHLSSRSLTSRGKALDEHQRPDLRHGGCVVMRLVQQLLYFKKHFALGLAALLADLLQVFGALRLVELFAPLHLLHQEGRWHGGVVLGIDRRTVQFAQVGGAFERVFQPLVSLVDAHRPLHGHALGGGALGGELVGVGLALQVFPARIQRRAVLRKRRSRPNSSKSSDWRFTRETTHRSRSGHAPWGC